MLRCTAAEGFDVSRISRETEPAEFRPETRWLIELDNTELALLFKHRAEAVHDALNGHTFWSDDQTVYWSRFTPLQDDLFEIMLEIQSRYPKKEACGRLLPVMEPKPVTTRVIR